MNALTMSRVIEESEQQRDLAPLPGATKCCMGEIEKEKSNSHEAAMQCFKVNIKKRRCVGRMVQGAPRMNMMHRAVKRVHIQRVLAAAR